MGTEHELKYTSSECMYEGIIVEVHDGGVVIDLKGRLGQLRIPKRMIISNYDLKVGQEVGFLMSYPEVFDEEPVPQYVRAIERQRKIMEERKQSES
ncbi:CBO2463/CBO2479 domain-containing protein [uncultured Megasphaera sp.]|uniref:CBO2463/CBO2479 domain-containing protein n=1 Tax=uncultured Megasphaera sp. TaxID=165188 RepID=UPI00265A007F|nr:CBO2463/CBO2479 domain-containing protein [uncultured Megasphaera sp.]